MSDSFFDIRMAKYLDVHRTHPPYRFEKSFFAYRFLYEGSPFMQLTCDLEIAEHIVTALNQAYLEGWLARQLQAEAEQKENNAEHNI